MSKKVLFTANQIFDKKRIYWVKSYKTLLKYISEDFKDVLKPTVIGKGKGKRYYIKEERLNDFIKKFEENKLNNKAGQKSS